MDPFMKEVMKLVKSRAKQKQSNLHKITREIKNQNCWQKVSAQKFSEKRPDIVEYGVCA